MIDWPVALGGPLLHTRSLRSVNMDTAGFVKANPALASIVND